jgi:hypothetical protein
MYGIGLSNFDKPILILRNCPFFIKLGGERLIKQSKFAGVFLPKPLLKALRLFEFHHR